MSTPSRVDLPAEDTVRGASPSGFLFEIIETFRTGIHVSDHCHTDLHKVLGVRPFSDDQVVKLTAL